MSSALTGTQVRVQDVTLLGLWPSYEFANSEDLIGGSMGMWWVYKRKTTEAGSAWWVSYFFSPSFNISLNREGAIFPSQHASTRAETTMAFAAAPEFPQYPKDS